MVSYLSPWTNRVSVFNFFLRNSITLKITSLASLNAWIVCSCSELEPFSRRSPYENLPAGAGASQILRV